MTQLDDVLHRLSEIPAMWRKAHDDTLAPRGTDLTSGMSRSQPGSREPGAADRNGWRDARKTARDLLIGLYRIDQTTKTPPVRDVGQPSNPLEVQQICDRLAVHLRASPVTRPRQQDLDKTIQAINKAHRDLEWTTAQAHRPSAPSCDTTGCTGGQQHGRRCYRCAQHKKRHGEYPIVTRVA